MAHGRAMIPHNRPLITAEDRAAVDAVLSSGWVAQGPQVQALEGGIARLNGGGGSCAVSSGTAALFLALKALNVEVGAKVAVPTYACSALLNAIYMAEAKPYIVDVQPDSFCLDPVALAQEAVDAACVIAVHTYGAAADIAAMRQSGRKLIEDCCHSLGGASKQGQLGAEGDVAVYSFYATKIITGGQGGLVWSTHSEVIERVRDYRQFDCRKDYIPRFNLQMTDIQAAMANSQMTRIDDIRMRRQLIAKRYLDALPVGFSTQTGLMEINRMVYRFVLVAPDIKYRDALLRHMRKANINCVIPIERYELLHNYMKLDPSNFPVAENLADTTLSIPFYPGLSDSDIEYICNTLRKFNL